MNMQQTLWDREHEKTANISDKGVRPANILPRTLANLPENCRAKLWDPV